MPETHTSGSLFLPQLVSQVFNRTMDDLQRHLREAGYDDLRPTHYLNVFRLIDCDGTRPTVLARRAGMTPQAMSELINYLEQRGYVRRIPDPADGRGRVVVYAERGMAAAEVAAALHAELESQWGAVVGAGQFQQMKSALAEILSHPPTESTPKGSRRD